jgi:hypothetical protein
MMKPDDAKTLRLTIGRSIMAVQDEAREEGYEVKEVLPEIIAALLSLANNIRKRNCGISDLDFIRGCLVAAGEDA